MQTYLPGTRIGQYEIASRPMMGGMGVVYFALDHGNDGRPVAIKTFRPELLPDRAARDRFLREGTAWIELGNHPHIVSCYKVEYIDPTAFLVLELIAKEQDMPDASLRSWLIPGRPLPLEQALFFAVQIARGMQHATEKIPGFVHRDLKPENILVGADKLPDTNINRLRVTDFGLAKTIAESGAPLTPNISAELKPNQIQFTRGAGTPLYMAPEQWKGEKVGAFTDIYAFGCILYEMLSGQYVAQGGTINELQMSHLNGKILPLPTDLPKDVMSMVNKCLALDSLRRFTVWSDVVQGLKAINILNNNPTISNIESVDQIQNYQQNALSFNAMGLAYRGIGKTQLSIQYFERTLSLAQTMNDKNLIGTALGNLGISYRELGDTQKAIELYEQSLRIFQDIKLRFQEGRTLDSLGNLYTDTGDVKKGITYHEQALKIAKETGYILLEGRILGNLGLENSKIYLFEKAESYCKQALVISKKVGDVRGEAAILNNLARILIMQTNLMEAASVLEQCLTVNTTIGNPHGEADALGNLGIIYKNLQNPILAIEYLNRSLKLCKEIGYLGGEANSSMNLAMTYVDQGKISLALPLVLRAAEIMEKIGNRSKANEAWQIATFLKRSLNL